LSELGAVCQCGFGEAVAVNDVIGDGQKGVFVFRHGEFGGLDCFFRAVHVFMSFVKCVLFVVLDEPFDFLFQPILGMMVQVMER